MAKNTFRKLQIKKILLISFLIVFSTLGFSQKFEGGLDLGMSASQIDNDNSGGYNKIGLNAGPYVNVFLRERLSIQSGISYITKGARNSSKQSYMNTHLDYVEVPFLINYYFKPTYISFTGGITLGYLIRGFADTGGGPKDIDVINFNPCSYWSINYQLGKKLTAKIAFNYGIIPNNGLSPATSFQWNHTVRVGFAYKIAYSKE